MHAYVSKANFARIYGCSKSYVTNLIAHRRLVLSEDGKRVNVDASLILLRATADPSKAGVRGRWEAYRAGGQEASSAPAAPRQAVVSRAPDTQPGGGEPRDVAGSEYHQARTLREQIEAQLAQIELRKAQGQLLETEPVLRAIEEIEATGRAEIMALASRLTTVVAPEMDARRVHDLITAECERVCAAIRAQFKSPSAAL